MKKRVLVVDDSVFVCEEIKYILDGTNYQVVGLAKDAEQAIKMYDELLPDVVTMDIIMPGMDGLDISRQILSKWEDARIVVVTALAYDECVVRAQKIGVSEFVYKPIKKEDLLAALDKVACSDKDK